MIADIKIGIVEDELLIAEKIKTMLEGIGYTVAEPATNFNEAMDMIRTDEPDLLILDINLESKWDGIDIAEKINSIHKLPFIFLTANSDNATVSRAKNVKPLGFIVKPFTRDELFTSVEIAFHNHSSLRAVQPDERNYIFIKDNTKFTKLSFNDITCVESNENYVIVSTIENRKHIVRSTFSDFISQLPAGLFVRTHRGFAVKVSLIENIEPTEVSIPGRKVPLSNSYKNEVFLKLGIR